MTPDTLPHRREVVAASIAAILAYAGFSVWVVVWSDDAALRGDVIGTWKSFAVLAFGFWLGSSSGGKSSTAEQQKQISDLTETTREMARSVPNASTDEAAGAADSVADAAALEADRIKGNPTNA